MHKTEIKSQYCQTQWGRVCYWLTASLSLPAGRQSSPHQAKIKLVLFLHGLGGSGRYWFSYLETLAQAQGSDHHIIAIAPDLLGFGASAKPQIDYTREVHLKVIEAVVNDCVYTQELAEAGPFELYLVGHSMGGILALLLADRLVRGVSRLNTGSYQLAKLGLLGTPYASPKHNLKQEVLRSPMNRVMLSRPSICGVVHHSLKLLWPLILLFIRRGFIKIELPLPVIADYMQHTCQSYTSSAHHVIFETDLDPALQLLQSSSLAQFRVLLVYSRSDEEVPWRHGQELTGWFKSCRLELLKEDNHQGLGQAALSKVISFIIFS